MVVSTAYGVADRRSVRGGALRTRRSPTNMNTANEREQGHRHDNEQRDARSSPATRPRRRWQGRRRGRGRGDVHRIGKLLDRSGRKHSCWRRNHSCCRRNHGRRRRARRVHCQTVEMQFAERGGRQPVRRIVRHRELPIGGPDEVRAAKPECVLPLAPDILRPDRIPGPEQLEDVRFADQLLESLRPFLARSEVDPVAE